MGIYDYMGNAFGTGQEPTPEEILAAWLEARDMQAAPGGSNSDYAMQMQAKQNAEPFRQANQTFAQPRPAPQRVAPQITFRPKPKPDPGDALDQLFNKLMGALGNGGPTVDYESALEQSEAAIRDAYANDIQAIRMGNQGARRQTANQREELEQMYNALAQTYQKAGKRSMRQADQLGDRIQDNANLAGHQVSKTANRMLDEQAARAQELGIEDAYANSAEPVETRAQQQVQQIQKEGNRDANRQLGFGGNSQRFMERGGQTARLEGTNRSADLLENLQNFLLQSRQQIAGLRGDRSRELAANESSIMGSVAEMNSAADSELWDRLMSMAGLKLDIDKERNDQSNDLARIQASLAGGGSGTSMPGAENFQNSQHYLSQLQRPEVGSRLFDQLLRSDEFKYGQVKHPQSGEMYKLTPEYAMDQIQRIAEEQGLSPQDINLLRLAVFTQMG